MAKAIKQPDRSHAASRNTDVADVDAADATDGGAAPTAQTVDNQNVTSEVQGAINGGPPSAALLAAIEAASGDSRSIGSPESSTSIDGGEAPRG
jgi:hypothetical protein